MIDQQIATIREYIEICHQHFLEDMAERGLPLTSPKHDAALAALACLAQIPAWDEGDRLYAIIDKLCKLGNGEYDGNSEGNCLAQEARALLASKGQGEDHEAIHHANQRANIAEASEQEKLVEINRAFSMLECNGIPRERAGTVANGIEVLMKRMRRERESMAYEIQELKKQAHPQPDAQGQGKPIGYVSFKEIRDMADSMERDGYNVYAKELRNMTYGRPQPSPQPDAQGQGEACKVEIKDCPRLAKVYGWLDEANFRKNEYLARAEKVEARPQPDEVIAALTHNIEELNKFTKWQAQKIADLSAAHSKPDAIRCPSCDCIVDERGHGHHSSADCIFMHLNDPSPQPDAGHCWEKDDRCNDCPAIIPEKTCPEYKVSQPDAGLRNWISIKDRQPEQRQSVLVILGPRNDPYSGSIRVCRYAPFDYGDGKTMHEFDMPGFGGLLVTHWMPLPDAPGALAKGEVTR